ncbi:MAG: redox-sensing transcriptional repressor Rex [Candidatus Omnitrophota bacterium]
MDKRIPEETITRLSYYLRALAYFRDEHRSIVSSRQLAQYLKITPHQLRRDLSYFGHFGKQGVGYSCENLIDGIRKILGLDREHRACVVGFGNLGRALSSYRGFQDQGIIIKAVFENDKSKINKTHKALKVYDLDTMEKVIREENIRIGIIAVPKCSAENIAQRLYACGIRAILNLAPVKLNIDKECIIKEIDLSCQLAYLTYRLNLKA